MNCKNCGYGLKQSCGDFEKILCTYEEGECEKITELEQQKNWLEGCKSELSEHLGKANDRIVELEKKNTALRQDWEIMKNTIADYNDFCDKYMRLEQENAELKEQNTNLQEMLKTERSVTCKEEYLKKVTELEQENAELKAGRPEWHDLRKDPNDLPKRVCYVLNQAGTVTAYRPDRGFLGLGGIMVIAWCEIPTFTDKE